MTPTKVATLVLTGVGLGLAVSLAGCTGGAAGDAVAPVSLSRPTLDQKANGADSPTPILISMSGKTFDLTNAANGVDFDIDNDGTTERIGWTTAGSDDAFLVLDRNGNGLVDNGRELFGDATPQPASPTPNGFLALAVFDQPANGGNSDGIINSLDAVYSSLRLWLDTNHNGISEPSELHTLASLGVAGIDLHYSVSSKTDANGNIFRYQSKVYGMKPAKVGKSAFDVILVQ